jgi:hypothetical protein
MDNVFSLELPEEKERCSFCSRPKSDCKTLVASPSGEHAICDRCLMQATKQDSTPTS